MDKVYQIFVSSTYADLAEERRKVSDTLAKAGYLPAGMELFPAADQQQLEFIKRVIDRCDYYVVIVGGRYGSLADDSVSYTEKEYEYAVSKQIPILAFLHGKPQKIEAGKTDQDQTQAKRLVAFRERLANGRIVDFWTEPQELCTKVVIAIAQAINLSPGIGWIRGDQAIDPKVLQETERIRIENANLRKRLDDLTADELHFPPNLAGPHDHVEFTLELTYKNEKEHDKADRTEIKKVTSPLGRIFIDIFDSVLGEPSEYNLRSVIGKALSKLISSSEKRLEFSIPIEEVVRLRYHFEALGLINAMGKTSSSGSSTFKWYNQYIVWTVTEKGRRYVAQAQAIQRPKQEQRA
jgi:hypothetical protein